MILHNDPWPAIVERVQGYEALGFDSVWVPDHFVYPWNPLEPWFEAWTLLAGLAERTRVIRLGSLISHMIYRQPAVLARQALTVDHLSNGRLHLGLGAGASGYDASMTGTPWWSPAERVQRFREAVEIIDRMLRTEVTTYQGQYYSVSRTAMNPRPLQRPRPPFTIGASGRSMVTIAAHYADTWNTEGAFQELYRRQATPDDVLRMARERSELLSEQAVLVGRDPDTIRRSFLFGFGAAPETPWASVDAFQHAVGRYAEIGFTEFIFEQPNRGELPVLERVAQEVIPSLRSATGG